MDNMWIKKGGYSTAGGDPVYECPKCGAHHVYGIEHPKMQNICTVCGQRNYYPWEKKDEQRS